VVFIAVNSGNSRAVVEEYVKSTKFEWPILVDEMRETEAKYGRKISLSNIYWYFVVAPDGTYGEFGADQGAAERHIEALRPKARMLLDGVNVPPELRPIGRRLEAGQLGEPVQELFRIFNKEKSEVSNAAHQLYLRVLPLGESRLKRAKDLESKGDNVGAYDGFTGVVRDFPGTPMAQEAQKGAEGLHKEKEVRVELNARGLLDQVRAALGKGKAGRAQARAILEGLVRSSPQTPSAETARRLVKSLDEGEKK
jgi:hypothetical protein